VHDAIFRCAFLLLAPVRQFARLSKIDYLTHTALCFPLRDLSFSPRARHFLRPDQPVEFLPGNVPQPHRFFP
jgi:hypothetical protein